MEEHIERFTPDQLWDYSHMKYDSTNFIIRRLMANFFRSIGHCIKLLPPDARVLEVGCGTGASSLRLQEFLQERYFEVSENDERYISEMQRRKFPIPFSQESVYNMNRSDEKFDCVIMLEVLEHLEYVDKALSEIFRVSSKYVIISVPLEPVWCTLNLLRGKYISAWGNTPGHINHFTPWRLRRLLCQYGVVQETHYPLPWIVMMIRKPVITTR